MFVTNNHTSFYVWGKENLVKYQKVPKYYDHDCTKISSFINFHVNLSNLLVANAGKDYQNIILTVCWIFVCNLPQLWA